jgi:CBS domain containing-hemolysin-like protein
MLTVPVPAHASLFSGDTLDFVANILAWVVLVIAPVIAITVFWLVHILPEKIAEERHHPQAGAIKTLCLLSLFFGGLLWPLAWLWAYSKPVLYKIAYGTDAVVHGAAEPVKPTDTDSAAAPPTLHEET